MTKLDKFDYPLPADRIAQRPLAERDASKLLVLDGATGAMQDRNFRDFPDLLRGDELLVFNNARVIPARLFGRRRGLRSQSPGKQSRARDQYLSSEIEVLLTRRINEREWEALVKPGRKIAVGETISFGGGELEMQVIARGEFGLRTLRVFSPGDPANEIEHLGHVPLPPYIRRGDEAEDRTRYQTVFAKQPGAVAAPTAGLHFTPEILDRLRSKVETCEVTLDVGLGTFQPIHEDEIEHHKIHSERYEISDESAEKIQRAKLDRRPIVAIGTTVVRTLEDAAQKAAGTEVVRAGGGEATIYIKPGFQFQLVDQLLTNFHLPRSSLLVLVSAFAGRETILAAYKHALASDYRFFSYGDCMLIR
ncbi:MAG TPA: tRNA preQ1(34) S-adenosylmethionine ribosyltransferase-isomerase QueA [Candidatus Acidoferrales bacterium]|nr:tRNA preQ1(34) S-adenosylmethionine ribosyltransferase-isomerase QueA [Candidatus Acidoferrales bacterium]